MGVRQYIGARYVTKIYENSGDPSSADWEANVNYEPLTMVTYNNGSYLSKREVPANVGNPAANPSYWVQTGFYNGQIASLQAQINAINAALSPLTNKEYIVICDSYGMFNNADNRNFYAEAFYRLGITNYHDFHRSGAGFSQPGSTSFLSVLTDNESYITDKTAITDIIVLGGANDQANYIDIESGISAFMSYVKSNYPNAKVQIGCMTHSLESAKLYGLRPSINLYRKCIKYGYAYIDNSEFIMAKMSFYQNDNLHPSTDGIDAMSNYMEQYLLTGNIEVNEFVNAPLISSVTPNAPAVTDDTISMIQHNGTVTMMATAAGSALRFNWTTPISLSAGVNALANLFSFSDGFFYSIGNLETSVQIIFHDVDNGGFIQGDLFAATIDSGMSAQAGFVLFADAAHANVGNGYAYMPNATFNLFV